MGDKDQDPVARTAKEGCGEPKTYSPPRARGSIICTKDVGKSGVQLLRAWGIRKRVWVHSVGGREAGEMGQQLRRLTALCRGPEFGF